MYGTSIADQQNSMRTNADDRSGVRFVGARTVRPGAEYSFVSSLCSSRPPGASSRHASAHRGFCCALLREGLRIAPAGRSIRGREMNHEVQAEQPPAWPVEYPKPDIKTGENPKPRPKPRREFSDSSFQFSALCGLGGFESRRGLFAVRCCRDFGRGAWRPQRSRIRRGAQRWALN